jgi:predicted GH43/DUF377 family glycosyl hydrolase
MSNQSAASSTTNPEAVRRQFFGDGLFEWQLPTGDKLASWEKYTFDESKYWGTFPRDAANLSVAELFTRYPWAIGPFTKYPNNPILAPTPGSWDCGHYDGGVHNGSIIIHDGRFHYVYRGERPIDVKLNSRIDYMCDIGLATSDDGIHFTKDDQCSPFFRKGDRHRFSFEDVAIARHEGVYYLFCNQWLWEDQQNPKLNGTFLATSRDLRNWEPHGIVFKNARRIHRNGVVVQDANNNAVRVNGKFVMYINDGLVGYSDDMIHWESEDLAGELWPGGEGCFALANHNPLAPDDIVLFTGGHHTGHFYAVGQVRFCKAAPTKAIAYLPRPMVTADPSIPYENGREANPPHAPISTYRDCIFFNGLTRHAGKWWMYYGGSEYYTCLATASA